MGDEMVGDKIEDLSFLDHPGILSRLFYPRKVCRSEIDPGSAISIEVGGGINLEGFSSLAKSSAPNLLLFHGNGETAYDYYDVALLYKKMGINFTVVDYRGYGTSGGFPGYSTMISDAGTVLCRLQAVFEERGFTGPTIVMGRSLGSAPAIDLALRYPDRIAGLIVESGFARTYRLLAKLGVDPGLLDPSREPLASNLGKMRRITLPLLVIHGELDEIIPLEDGKCLYRSSPAVDKAILVIPGAGHNTLMLYGLEDYLGSIGGFVGRIAGGM